MSLPFLGVWLALTAWAPPASAAPLTPDDAVRAALAHDPAFVAATSAVAAARADVRAATFLRENPTVSGDYSLTSDRLGAAIEQPVSLTGEGVAARAAASRRFDAAEATRIRAALTTAAGARLAWAEAVAADARATLAAQVFEQSTTRRAAVEARVAAGDAPQLDARLARLDEARAAEALVSGRNGSRDARVALAQFVPDAGAVELPADPLLAAPVALGGRDARADVTAAERRADAAGADLRAARAAGFPALTLGAFVERDEGVLAVGPSVGLTLPLWHQNGAGIAAAEAEAAILAAEALLARTRASAEQSGSVIAERDANAALARLTVPAAEDAQAALLALDEAQARGELDAAAVTLLRSEVLAGWSASIDLRVAVAEARIQALLATEDPALLPPELREALP
jgi:cobalt-zinc-cadmium efflux system outer membrane protein